MDIWDTKICDVCRLVDGDVSQKHCKWCTTCKAWICESDLLKLDRRALAMYKIRKERNKINA